jgi:DNA processing protein
MAALSDATLLIEADLLSGTLITARHALELGKDIGIVPGSIFSPNSSGTHSLLKDGAIPICTKEDLFELLHLQSTKPAQDEVKKDLTEYESRIYELLREPCNKDTLLVVSKLSAQDFMIALTTLEMKGYIQETFGEVRRVV